MIQRQNVGYIRALGLEGDASYALDDRLSLRSAFNVTDAHVFGGTLAPQLTGKRPAQTPRWTITAGVVATPDPLVTLEAYVRYESLRWSDDLNALPLPGVATIDTRVNVHVTPTMDVYAAIDNLFNAEVTTMRGADGVANIEAPRLFRLGIRLVY